MCAGLSEQENGERYRKFCKEELRKRISDGTSEKALEELKAPGVLEKLYHNSLGHEVY